MIIFKSTDDSVLGHTPLTISQISEIDPSTTVDSAFKKKSRKAQGSDDTLEMAVHYARGEPDGAER